MKKLILILTLGIASIGFAGAKEDYEAAQKLAQDKKLDESLKALEKITTGTDKEYAIKAGYQLGSFYIAKKEYETAYKNQIEEIAKKKNIQVKKITFWWDNKKEHLKQIEIRGILLKGSDSTLHTTDNPSHVESLKKILMQLYDLEESDVFVEVE